MKIFISLPAKNLGSLSSVSCSNISLIQDCLDRLQRKLKEFESLHTTVAADDYVEVPDISESEFQEPIESAPGVKDDSPPFESSPGEVSEKIDRTAPLPITEPNKKFVFKKPGSSSTRQTSSIPAVTSSIRSSFVSSSHSTSPSFTFSTSPAPSATFRSSTSHDSGFVSSFSSASTNNSVTSSSSKVNSGTQFIEDFNTQSQEADVNYASMMYDKCDDINREGKFIGEAKNDGKCPELSREDYSFR